MRTLTLAVVLAAAICGCTTPRHARPELTISTTLTDPTIGAGQGVTVIDDMLVLYGDADTGVASFYTMDALPPAPPAHVVRLTQESNDLIPHPTGLAHHPELGTFIGNTVKGFGTIFHIDLDAALRKGDLDGAVTRIIDDDLAVNGTRPEFVRYEGEWFVATADYGDVNNTLRLYRPNILAKRARTSVDRVLAHSFPCPPFVQTIEWIDDKETLVLVQNQTAGLGYRLTFCTLKEGALNQIAVVDLDEPKDELEGFAVLPDGRFVMVSSSPEGNVHLGEIDLPER